MVNLIALAARAARLTANIGRRVGRIKAAGNINNATQKFDELRQMARPTDAKGWQARVRELERLDAAPGTRARTAGQTARRDATRARNDDLRARSTDVNQRISMSNDDIRDAARLARSDVRRRIRTLRKAVGDSHGARLAEAAADALNLDGTRNEVLSDLSRLVRVKGYKTLTPSGARAVEDAGAEAFGEGFRFMDDEQKSAIWRKMEETQVKESLSSQEVQAMIKAVMEDKTQVLFTRTTNPDGTSYLTADFGTSLKDAVAQKARREKSEELLRQYVEESEPNPFFEDLRKDSTNLFG